MYSFSWQKTRYSLFWTCIKAVAALKRQKRWFRSFQIWSNKLRKSSSWFLRNCSNTVRICIFCLIKCISCRWKTRKFTKISSGWKSMRKYPQNSPGKCTHDSATSPQRKSWRKLSFKTRSGGNAEWERNVACLSQSKTKNQSQISVLKPSCKKGQIMALKAMW